MKKLLILFIIIPLVEILLLIKLGQEFGVGMTLFLVVGFGVLGVVLVKKQGLYVFYQLRTEISRGHLPGDTIIDGLIFLIGGVLLITPGIITASIGLILMVPRIRRLVREFLKGLLINQLHLTHPHIGFKGW